MKVEQKLLNNFSHNIKTRRERMEWTQEELSVKAGVTKNTICDIEAGKKFVRAKTLVKLAIAFDTEEYELLKPKNVMPDKAKDKIIKFSEEIREVGRRYLLDDE